MHGGPVAVTVLQAHYDDIVCGFIMVLQAYGSGRL